MKLSEIKGEAALDVIEAMLNLAERIVGDDSFRNALDGKDGTAAQALAVAKLLLSKGYRDDTIPVLAALSQKSVEDYLADTTLPQMLGDVYSAITDAELLSFLSPQGDEPGTISEDTLEG